MNKRVKEIRKLKNLSQAEFGAKINLSQRAVSEIENGTNGLTERNFNAICKAFSVNPEWLRSGEGSMFVETRETLIQSLVDEYGLDDDERILLRTFLALPKEHRAGVLAWAKSMAATFAEREGIEFHLSPKQQKPDSELTTEEAMEKVRYEWEKKEDAKKRETSTSLASIISSGSSKKFGTSP